MLVARAELDSAIAVDSAGYNLARAVGPVIAGFAIARLGADVPSGAAGSEIWRSLRRYLVARAAKSERDLSGGTADQRLMTGVRYVRYSREMDATLIRAVAFFPFASAYLALLPLVARTQMRGGPEVYGALLAAIGAGSIAASFALKQLKARWDPTGLPRSARSARSSPFSCSPRRESFLLRSLAPDRWRIVDSYVGDPLRSAQVALPEWVRGRGLAIFLTVYFGAVTFGSAAWGEVASLEGLPFALAAAAAVAWSDAAHLGWKCRWARR